MVPTRYRWLLCLILALLVLSVPVTAMAKEIGKLVVSGPGISGELTLEDGEALGELLYQYGFLQPGQFADRPAEKGEGFTLVQWTGHDDEMVETQRAIYYPDPNGGRGLIYRIDPGQGNSTEPTGRWYLAFPPAEALFKEMLAGQGVTLPLPVTPAEVQPASEAAIPTVDVTQPDRQDPPPALAALRPRVPGLALWGFVLLSLTGAAWVLVRRAQRVHQVG